MVQSEVLPLLGFIMEVLFNFLPKVAVEGATQKTPSLPQVSLLGDTTNICWFFNDHLLFLIVNAISDCLI